MVDNNYYLIDRYNRVRQAFLFAKEKHKDQLRKNGSLYINHPIAVSNLIDKYYFSYDNNLELKIAAYLHDTVEDTNTSIEEIRSIFGDYVAYLVLGVTNDNELISVVGKSTYLADKLLFMEDDVLDLKLCDRLANVMDLVNADEVFRNKYLIETMNIINNLITNRKLSTEQIEVIRDINKEIRRLNSNYRLKKINNNY